MGFFRVKLNNHARLALLVPLAASGLALAGCVGSPTYGTGVEANEQLLSDVTGSFSLKPAQKNTNIDYKPRPDLVKPAPGQKEALPAPQDNVTQTAGAEWPESPEQRRARIRANATANQNNKFFQPEVENDLAVKTDGPVVSSATEHENWRPEQAAKGQESRRAEINRRLVESKQGDPNTRKYLSDPPLTYRKPADTAPQDDIGEDEWKKERRLKREATKSGGLFDWLPSL